MQRVRHLLATSTAHGRQYRVLGHHFPRVEPCTAVIAPRDLGCEAISVRLATYDIRREQARAPAFLMQPCGLATVQVQKACTRWCVVRRSDAVVRRSGKLLEAYVSADSSPRRAIAACGVALALFCAVTTGAVNARYGDASRSQTREAARGRLAVEQPAIAHARDVYAGRRAAHARINQVLSVRQ